MQQHLGAGEHLAEEEDPGDGQDHGRHAVVAGRAPTAGTARSGPAPAPAPRVLGRRVVAVAVVHRRANLHLLQKVVSPPPQVAEEEHVEYGHEGHGDDHLDGRVGVAEVNRHEEGRAREVAGLQAEPGAVEMGLPVVGGFQQHEAGHVVQDGPQQHDGRHRLHPPHRQDPERVQGEHHSDAPATTTKTAYIHNRSECAVSHKDSLYTQ